MDSMVFIDSNLLLGEDQQYARHSRSPFDSTLSKLHKNTKKVLPDSRVGQFYHLT
jgi:hypothetical protein